MKKGFKLPNKFNNNQLKQDVINFVNEIIDMNVENNVNIKNPLFVELLLDNIESVFGNKLKNNDKLQAELAVEIFNIIEKKAK